MQRRGGGVNALITKTLQQADNEGTESPYWLIIDPSAILGALVWLDGDEKIYAELDDKNCERVADNIPHCITGPFFSREDAEGHLTARKYAFSSKAYVYCHSGYWSQKYKTFCREIFK
jgi:hypothetical protein